MMMRGFVTFLSALFIVPLAMGAGYTTADTSVISMGMAGTGVARADDPAAAFLNPAAILFKKGTQVSIGAVMAMPSLSADDGNGAVETEGGFSVPPNLHVGYSDETFAFGGSFTVPFGSGLAWPSDWSYRFDIVSAEMKVLRASTFVGARYGMVSIAGGPHLDISTLGLERQIDFISDEGSVVIDTSAFAVGGHVGIYLQPLDSLSLGLTYRSASSFEFSGSANFQTPDEFQSRATSGPVSTSLTMPHRLAVGLEWEPVERVALAFEVERNQWSSVDVLLIDFEDPGTEDVEKVRNWKDTTALRFAGSYAFDNGTDVRTGIFWDPSPVTDESVSVDSPDSSRLGLSVGLGLPLSDAFAVDVAYQFLGFQGAESSGEDPSIAFTGNAHLLGFAFRYTEG